LNNSCINRWVLRVYGLSIIYSKCISSITEKVFIYFSYNKYWREYCFNLLHTKKSKIWTNFYFCALQVNLDKLFWSKPCSLALLPDSPLRVDEPDYQGFKRFMLKLMLFYSKQSKSIRGANVVYKRIVSQVDKPLIYEGLF
jgi:hypothetical protein